MVVIIGVFFAGGGVRCVMLVLCGVVVDRCSVRCR